LETSHFVGIFKIMNYYVPPEDETIIASTTNI